VRAVPLVRLGARPEHPWCLFGDGIVTFEDAVR
jgi:hypothetical protein